MRKTYKDCQRMATLIDEYLKLLDLLPQGWMSHIEKGSKTNGRTYKLVLINKEFLEIAHTGYSRSCGILGWTPTEAYHTLDTIASTLEAVCRKQCNS